MLICTPEYAFGVPGSLKNALDWTVSTGEFYRKPVAVISASPSAEETFRRGMATFPDNRVLQVFLAMTLYNLYRYQEAMELLLTTLAETTSDTDHLDNAY